jgi:hypothetical protein
VPYTEGVAQHSPRLPSLGYPGRSLRRLQASGVRHEPVGGATPRVAAEKMRQPWAMVGNAFGVDQSLAGGHMGKAQPMPEVAWARRAYFSSSSDDRQVMGTPALNRPRTRGETRRPKSAARSPQPEVRSLKASRIAFSVIPSHDGDDALRSAVVAARHML